MMSTHTEQRAVLIERYWHSYETSPEKSLEWCTARDVYGFVSGPAPLSWVIAELRKVQERFRLASEERGYAQDAEYGTYGTYCSQRIASLDVAIRELEDEAWSD